MALKKKEKSGLDIELIGANGRFAPDVSQAGVSPRV